jgi:hypothetical protein
VVGIAASLFRDDLRFPDQRAFVGLANYARTPGSGWSGPGWRNARAREGEEITLAIEPSGLLLFDADSGERLEADT